MMTSLTSRKDGRTNCFLPWLLPQVESFLVATIFSTLTNVNFDDRRMYEFILQGDRLKVNPRQPIRSFGLSALPPFPAQTRLQDQLIAHEKPMPETPATGAEYWGTLPHPLEFSLSGD